MFKKTKLKSDSYTVIIYSPNLDVHTETSGLPLTTGLRVVDAVNKNFGGVPKKVVVNGLYPHGRWVKAGDVIETYTEKEESKADITRRHIMQEIRDYRTKIQDAQEVIADQQKYMTEAFNRLASVTN